MGDELTAVSWCDGDHSQIDTIVSLDGIHWYSANNVIANKHNASGTGKEQACDLGKVFTISKKLNKSTTVEHIPSSNHKVVVPPGRVELASVFILIWSKQDVIGMTMTLGSITLSHPRQVHVLLLRQRKDIMSISRPTLV
jgi:hypothetical protein